jgi:hypothetical protein
MKSGRRYLLFWGIAVGLYSCSVTKFVPEGEYLLNKVKIESDVPGHHASDLKPYLKQQPNFKMLIFGKTMLYVYNWAGKDSSLWINRLWKKIGDEPVIFDSASVYKTEKEFEKLLVNRGYMDVEVRSDIVRNNKKANVIYSIKGNKPYPIRDYNTLIEDDSIAGVLENINNEPRRRIGGETPAARIPFVKKRMLFDRNLLDAERDRITTLLRNRGYYAFIKENIDYDAFVDTSSNISAVDLTLKLHLTPDILPNGNYVEIPHKKYFYDKVNIYLDYDPLLISDINNYPKQDSIESNGYTVFYLGNEPSIRPEVLIDNCFMTPSGTYSQLMEDITYSSFSNLNALSNIHIRFDEKMRNDSALLDCSILTMPTQKQSFSFSVEGTNTAGDLGIASSVNYLHRNLFRGAETFNLKVRGAYEAISNLMNPFLELGGEVSIRFPKFVFPFINRSFLRMMQTSTELSVNYNYQTRPEYDRTIFSAGLRYAWQGRNRLSARHQFDLLDVDYVYLPREDSVFMNNLPASAKYFGYIDQFIVGMNYTYYHSTFDPLQKQRDAQIIRFSLESAGNALRGLSALFGWEKDEYGSYHLFNTYFAQFVKGDFDYSRTRVIDRYNSVAWRIGGGIGIPYGNSKMLPFEKRYYSGGANSVRAWTMRELGPGAYIPVDTTTFFNQSGDIKLDFNIEYRTRFFWKLEAAAFIDAGNNWTIRDYSGQENGKFRLDRFYKQIALGYGLGLRLDYDFFLIRFDCGWKIYNPAKRGKEAWAFLHPNFGDNWAWHIAVGYPF